MKSLARLISVELWLLLMLELLPPLNDHNLPWMDTIHPIVVHFVIAKALRISDGLVKSL